MNTPRPYKEKRTKDFILREFNEKLNSNDLIWHQDKYDRVVEVIEDGGWSLQLQEGLPFRMISGQNYFIPSKTWHRIIKGVGPLKIKIKENKMKFLKKLIREMAKEPESDFESLYDRKEKIKKMSYEEGFSWGKDNCTKLNPKDSYFQKLGISRSPDMIKIWEKGFADAHRQYGRCPEEHPFLHDYLEDADTVLHRYAPEPDDPLHDIVYPRK